MAFFAIIPLIFVFVGGGGIYAMFFSISLPAESNATPRFRRLAKLTAGALLSLLGCAILYTVFWKTYAHNLDAQNWPARLATSEHLHFRGAIARSPARKTAERRSPG